MKFLEGIMDSSQLQDSREFVTIVGAGGKTSTMYTLAKELKSRGKRVLVTTTTAIYHPEGKDYDQIFIGDKQELLNNYREYTSNSDSGEIVIWARTIDSAGKLRGVSPEDLDEIWKKKRFSWILVEGDGARGKNIKAPKEGEPVIPSKTTLLIGVIGMKILDKSVEESSVHRLEHFADVTGASKGDIISEDILRKLVLNKKGLFKATPEKGKIILLLNQCEDQDVQDRALVLANSLSIPYLVTSLQKQKLYGARKISK